MRIQVDDAVKILKNGGNVGIPTETVYGLAALYNQKKAIEAIFTLKGRPRNNPLIIHVADIATIQSLAINIPESFYNLAEAFWPGPLALVMESDKNKILESVRAGLPKACFRIPDHPLALEVILKAGPLVMPSANLSGKPSPTDCQTVEEDFGAHFPVLDGGGCVNGIESTILIYEESRWHLGRLGSLALEEIDALLGYTPESKNDKETPLCPGQKWRHYAPNAKLIVTKEPPKDIEAIIGFDELDYSKTIHFFSLGSLYTPAIAASRLYSHLRELDRKGIQIAWIDTNFPEKGLWRTLGERIKKASE